ncbi:hypothetical protein ACFWF7_03325 [Nocardia sp. NPDC060256]|uniref:hypothetical protein n=1 Tax=unclassified Nocardia TaxID=2637762 RepID=UPI0036560C68
MLVSSRVLARAALVAGVGLLIPAPATALADIPTAPTLCTPEQERNAEGGQGGDSMDSTDAGIRAECARRRTESASIRMQSVPLGGDDPEKITPYTLKTDIGVSPKERKAMFGGAKSSKDPNEAGTYEDAAIFAAYYTVYYAAHKGGAVYFDRETLVAEMDGVKDKEARVDLMVRKGGGGDGAPHDDANLTPELLKVKETAVAASARARILAGDSSEGLSKATPDVVAMADIEARDSTTPGLSLENRVAANEAEAAAVDAAVKAGWLKK